MSYLALVRHGESEYNAQNLWTGLLDIELTDVGRSQARACALLLKDIVFHHCHTSELKRAQDTLQEITKALRYEHLPIHTHAALNERDYGELTGKNKDAMKSRFGEEQFMRWRRGWDEPMPHGETLKDVYERVVAYFERYIRPQLLRGENVLVAAHGNSLRALIKYLEDISNEVIPYVEVKNCEIHLYQLDERGRITQKEVRVVAPEKVKSN